MTYGEIVDAQAKWSKRFGSSAAGGYQFMRKTLQDLSRQILSISGTDRFTPDLLDRLAQVMAASTSTRLKRSPSIV